MAPVAWSVSERRTSSERSCKRSAQPGAPVPSGAALRNQRRSAATVARMVALPELATSRPGPTPSVSGVPSPPIALVPTFPGPIADAAAIGPGKVGTRAIGGEGTPETDGVGPGRDVASSGRATIRATVAADRSWLRRAAPLGAGAPGWALRLHDRSLLVLRSLTDHATGAIPAGLRDFWDYVWPRDAATAALALSEGGYPELAGRIARF